MPNLFLATLRYKRRHDTRPDNTWHDDILLNTQHYYNTAYYYVECLFIVMPSVVMPNVIMLNVVAPHKTFNKGDKTSSAFNPSRSQYHKTFYCQPLLP
jgi:hypothetical protein